MDIRTYRAAGQPKMSERQTKAGNLANLQTCTLSFTHTGHAEQLLFSCLCSKVTLTFSHSLSLSRSFNLSFTHSRHAEQLLFSSLCWKVTLTLSHSHSLSLCHSHSRTLSISHSITLDMLNKLCFYLYAENSLFIAENCNAFFLDLTLSSTLSC